MTRRIPKEKPARHAAAAHPRHPQAKRHPAEHPSLWAELSKKWFPNSTIE
jgi:hypothetical protein